MPVPCMCIASPFMWLISVIVFFFTGILTWVCKPFVQLDIQPPYSSPSSSQKLAQNLKDNTESKITITSECMRTIGTKTKSEDSQRKDTTDTTELKKPGSNAYDSDDSMRTTASSLLMDSVTLVTPQSSIPHDFELSSSDSSLSSIVIAEKVFTINSSQLSIENIAGPSTSNGGPLVASNPDPLQSSTLNASWVSTLKGTRLATSNAGPKPILKDACTCYKYVDARNDEFALDASPNATRRAIAQGATRITYKKFLRDLFGIPDNTFQQKRKKHEQTECETMFKWHARHNARHNASHNALERILTDGPKRADIGIAMY